jgi:hypothetical protein
MWQTNHPQYHHKWMGLKRIVSGFPTLNQWNLKSCRSPWASSI